MRVTGELLSSIVSPFEKRGRVNGTVVKWNVVKVNNNLLSWDGIRLSHVSMQLTIVCLFASNF